MADARVLTLNAGSSSLKFALFAADAEPRRLTSGTLERKAAGAGDHDALLDAVFARVDADPSTLTAIGHRVVHGGPRFVQPTSISDALLAELRRLSPLDPDHLPAEVAILEATRQRAPRVPQVACFDTAFHDAMPRVARLLPIPRRYEAEGVRRYGFHGLSYEFLTQELARVAGEAAARGRVVMAHLGSGASLAAARDGRCVDTTMAFTPNSGVMMGTRSGDLDPGVVLHLLRTERLTADALDDLLSRKSGLLGVSETSADMRELLAREADDVRAAEAVALFCQSVRKAIGALAAVLGGVETLVFAGGIGENAPPLRARIVEGLEHLGVQLDAGRNASGAGVVSREGSACTVRVVRTDEESIIARHTLDVVRAGSGA